MASWVRSLWGSSPAPAAPTRQNSTVAPYLPPTGPVSVLPQLDNTLDVSEVFSRIFIVGMPYKGITSRESHRNNADELVQWMHSRFGREFAVWNLASDDRCTIPEVVFRSQVLKFPPLLSEEEGHTDDGLPQIGEVFRFIYSLHFWLELSPEHIAIVHDVNGRTRAPFLVAAYLAWAHPGVFHDSVEAITRVMDIRVARGSKPVHFLRSWWRTLLAFDQLCSRADHATPPRRLKLQRVLIYMSGPIREHAYLRVEIFQGSKCVWDSDADQGTLNDDYRYDEGCLKVVVDRVVSGDIQVHVSGEFAITREAHIVPTPTGELPDMSKWSGYVEQRMTKRLLLRYAFHTNALPGEVIQVPLNHVDVLRPEVVLDQREGDVSTSDLFWMNMVLGAVPNDNEQASSMTSAVAAIEDPTGVHAADGAVVAGEVLALDPSGGDSVGTLSTDHTADLKLQQRMTSERDFVECVDWLNLRGRAASLAGLFHFAAAHTVFPPDAMVRSLVASFSLPRDYFAMVAIQIAERDPAFARQILLDPYMRHLYDPRAVPSPSAARRTRGASFHDAERLGLDAGDDRYSRMLMSPTSILRSSGIDVDALNAVSASVIGGYVHNSGPTDTIIPVIATTMAGMLSNTMPGVPAIEQHDAKHQTAPATPAAKHSLHAAHQSPMGDADMIAAHEQISSFLREGLLAMLKVDDADSDDSSSSEEENDDEAPTATSQQQQPSIDNNEGQKDDGHHRGVEIPPAAAPSGPLPTLMAARAESVARRQGITATTNASPPSRQPSPSPAASSPTSASAAQSPFASPPAQRGRLGPAAAPPVPPASASALHTGAAHRTPPQQHVSRHHHRTPSAGHSSVVLGPVLEQLSSSPAPALYLAGLQLAAAVHTAEMKTVAAAVAAGVPVRVATGAAAADPSAYQNASEGVHGSGGRTASSQHSPSTGAIFGSPADVAIRGLQFSSPGGQPFRSGAAGDVDATSLPSAGSSSSSSSSAISASALASALASQLPPRTPQATSQQHHRHDNEQSGADTSDSHAKPSLLSPTATAGIVQARPAGDSGSLDAIIQGDKTRRALMNQLDKFRTAVQHMDPFVVAQLLNALQQLNETTAQLEHSNVQSPSAVQLAGQQPKSQNKDSRRPPRPIHTAAAPDASSAAAVQAIANAVMTSPIGGGFAAMHAAMHPASLSADTDSHHTQPGAPNAAASASLPAHDAAKPPATPASKSKAAASSPAAEAALDIARTESSGSVSSPAAGAGSKPTSQPATPSSRRGSAASAGAPSGPPDAKSSSSGSAAVGGSIFSTVAGAAGVVVDSLASLVPIPHASAAELQSIADRNSSNSGVWHFTDAPHVTTGDEEDLLQAKRAKAVQTLASVLATDPALAQLFEVLASELALHGVAASPMRTAMSATRALLAMASPLRTPGKVQQAVANAASASATKSGTSKASASAGVGPARRGRASGSKASSGGHARAPVTPIPSANLDAFLAGGGLGSVTGGSQAEEGVGYGTSGGIGASGLEPHGGVLSPGTAMRVSRSGGGAVSSGSAADGALSPSQIAKAAATAAAAKAGETVALGGGVDAPAADSAAAAVAPPADASAAAIEAAAGAASAFDTTKYERMLKMGIPREAVRHKMIADSVPVEAMDRVLGESTPKVAPAAAEVGPQAAAATVGGSKTEGASAAASSSASDKSLSQLPLEEQIKRLKKEQEEAAAEAQKPLAESALYGRYFKMVRVGTPPDHVQRSMVAAGLDPAVIHMDGTKPHPAGFVSLKDDGTYGKYFKMRKFGLPLETIEHKLKADGLDPIIMSLEPDLPVPPSLSASNLLKKSGEQSDVSGESGGGVHLPSKPKRLRKRLHWEVLPADRVLKGGTIWSSAARENGDEYDDGDDIIDDEEEFMRLFTAEATVVKASSKAGAAGTDASDSSGAGSSGKQKVVELLDSKRGRNVGIGLAKLKIPHEQLRSCLAALTYVLPSAAPDAASDAQQKQQLLQPSPRSAGVTSSSGKAAAGEAAASSTSTTSAKTELTIEMLLVLEDILPTPDEITLVKAYRGDKSRLADPEKFYLCVADVPKLKQRASALAFQRQFAARSAEVTSRVKLLMDACAQVRGSKRLRRVLEATLKLGNRLNAADDDDGRGKKGGMHHHGGGHGRAMTGSASAAVAGFTLQSLLKLAHTKAFNGKTTVLQYLAAVLARKDVDALELGADLPLVAGAARVDVRILKEDLSSLRKDLSNVERLVREQARSAHANPSSSTAVSSSGLSSSTGGLNSSRDRGESASSVLSGGAAGSGSGATAGHDAAAAAGDTMAKPDATLAAEPGAAPAVPTLADFVATAQAALSTLSQDTDSASSAFSDLVSFFGEDENMSVETFFSTLHQFVKALEKARNDNADEEAKQQREARRKAAEEASAQAAAAKEKERVDAAAGGDADTSSHGGGQVAATPARTQRSGGPAGTGLPIGRHIHAASTPAMPPSSSSEQQLPSADDDNNPRTKLEALFRAKSDFFVRTGGVKSSGADGSGTIPATSRKAPGSGTGTSQNPAVTPAVEKAEPAEQPSEAAAGTLLTSSAAQAPGPASTPSAVAVTPAEDSAGPSTVDTVAEGGTAEATTTMDGLTLGTSSSSSLFSASTRIERAIAVSTDGDEIDSDSCSSSNTAGPMTSDSDSRAAATAASMVPVAAGDNQASHSAHAAPSAFPPLPSARPAAHAAQVSQVSPGHARSPAAKARSTEPAKTTSKAAASAGPTAGDADVGDGGDDAGGGGLLAAIRARSKKRGGGGDE